MLSISFRHVCSEINGARETICRKTLKDVVFQGHTREGRADTRWHGTTTNRNGDFTRARGVKGSVRQRDVDDPDKAWPLTFVTVVVFTVCRLYHRANGRTRRRRRRRRVHCRRSVFVLDRSGCVWVRAIRFFRTRFG